jgi:hypothetical protein
MITGGSGLRIMKHSSRFHSNSFLFDREISAYWTEEEQGNPYSSHLNDHRKDKVPVYLISTTEVGLHNSIVLTLFTGDGAVAVASNDSDMGSKAR